MPWLFIVGLYVVLAVAGPIKIIAKRDTGSGSQTGAAGAQEAQEATVRMAGIKFTPATLTVRRGTEVLFDNNDVAPHTVTAEAGGTDSGIISPGKAFRFVVNERFVYFCAIHPSMKATIEIAA